MKFCFRSSTYCLLVLLMTSTLLFATPKTKRKNLKINKIQNTEAKNTKLTTEEIIKASLKAIGTEAKIKSIVNITSLANCVSPQGNYTTETHTTSSGYGYFKQIYSYRPQPFEAITKNKTQGFQLGNALSQLPRNAVYAIRTHYFHQLILDIEGFFHDFGEVTIIEIDGKQMYQIKAKDELNEDSWLFFDIDKKFFTAFYIQNPDNKEEIIKTRFSNWKEVQLLQLPHHLEIEQSGKSYVFDFTEIIVNDPKFEEKTLK